MLKHRETVISVNGDPMPPSTPVSRGLPDSTDVDPLPRVTVAEPAAALPGWLAPPKWFVFALALYLAGGWWLVEVELSAECQSPSGTGSVSSERCIQEKWRQGAFLESKSLMKTLAFKVSMTLCETKS